MSENLRMLLIVLGVSVPIGLGARLYFHRRHPRATRAWAEYNRSLKWPVYALGTGLFVFAAAAMMDDNPYLTGVFVLCGGFQAVAMVASIYRHRSQWTVRTLLVAAVVVAVVCSLILSVGRPILPVLAGTCVVGILGLGGLAGVRRWRSQSDYETNRGQRT